MSEPIILVIEDSDEDYATMERAFRQTGITGRLIRCEDGERALDYLYHRGDYQERHTSPRPNLILLDLNLPGTDGRALISEIKGANSLKSIPLIVLTTSSQEIDVRWCYEVGANSFITKPLGYDDFVRYVAGFQFYWLDVVSLPCE